MNLFINRTLLQISNPQTSGFKYKYQEEFCLHKLQISFVHNHRSLHILIGQAHGMIFCKPVKIGEMIEGVSWMIGDERRR